MTEKEERMTRRFAETMNNGNSEKYDFTGIVPLDDSPLKGKRILVLGSSVAFGAASMENGPAEYFSRRFSCEYTKEAVSGTTLCTLKENSYIERLKKLDTGVHYDLFICQLSTNDAAKGFPLGEISEDDTYDIKTITGAMEYIINYVRNTWGCPVGFFTGSRFDNDNYQKMYDRLMELKEKYQLFVLDLWKSDEFNNISDEARDTCMFDPIHPTKAGYRDWWCPEMENQLISYLQNNSQILL